MYGYIQWELNDLLRIYIYKNKILYYFKVLIR